MSAVLRRRYARLLRAYPAEVRRVRGAEMLTTVVEVAPEGRRWPQLREAASLVLAGLRERSGTERHRSTAELLLSAVRLGVVLLLAHGAASAVSWALELAPHVPTAIRTGGVWTSPAYLWFVVLVAYTAALAAVARNRFTAGSLLIVVGIVCAALTNADAIPLSMTTGQFWQMPLVLLLLLPLQLRVDPVEPPASFGWLLAVPAAVFLMTTQISYDLGLQPWGYLSVILIAAVWAVADRRVPIAMGLLLLPYVVDAALGVANGQVAGAGGSVGAGLWFVLPTTAFFASGAVVARRRARM